MSSRALMEVQDLARANQAVYDAMNTPDPLCGARLCSDDPSDMQLHDIEVGFNDPLRESDSFRFTARGPSVVPRLQVGETPKSGASWSSVVS